MAGPGRNDKVCVDVQQADGEVQQLRHGGRQEPSREEARPPSHQGACVSVPGSWDLLGSSLNLALLEPYPVTLKVKKIIFLPITFKFFTDGPRSI